MQPQAFNFAHALRSNTPFFIEASAGTGKTWTLERLVAARLLGLHTARPTLIQDFLILTFTEAASEELRERIQAMLEELLTPQGRADFEAALGLRASTLVHEVPDWEQRLAQALAGLPHASISTIHGFATLVLKNYSLQTDLSERFTLDQTWLQDAWRTWLHREFLEAKAYATVPEEHWPRVLSALLSTLHISDTEDLHYALSEVYAKGYTRAELFYSNADQIRECFQRMFLSKEGLDEPLRSLLHCLMDDKLETKRAKPDIADEVIPLLDFLKQCLEPCPDASSFLDTTSLGNSKKANSAISALIQRIAGWGLYLHMDRSFQAWLPNYREYGQKLGFDDLIHRLWLFTRPQGTSDAALSHILRQRYSCVLIDEFQDTDPLQWDIFKTCFLGHRAMYLIGDPKQAIYGFRGGDLNTYLRARSEIAARQDGCILYLSHNYRSNPGLIKALNRLGEALFVDSSDPGFLAVEPGLKEHSSLRLARHCPPAQSSKAGQNSEPSELKLKPLPSLGTLPIETPPQGKSKTGYQIQRIFDNLATLIHRLLDGRTMLLDSDQAQRPLMADDICILIDTNTRARKLFRFLSKSGISASLMGNQNLFDSPEGLDLRLLLAAMSDPDSTSAILRFTLSRLFGAAASDLHDEDYRIKLLARARDFLTKAQKLYTSSGLLPVLALLEEPGLANPDAAQLWQRLLNAEQEQAFRSWTNFRHLFELCDRDFSNNRTSPQQLLLRYLRISTVATGESNLKLRLDRELPAVRIMTLHSSKGLEFPIVFVLQGLATRESKQKFACIEHHSNTIQGTKRRSVDFFNLEPSKQTNKQDSLDEARRLAYVAYTRAQAALFLLAPPAQLTEPDTGLSSSAAKKTKTASKKTSVRTSSSQAPVHNYPGAKFNYYQFAPDQVLLQTSFEEQGGNLRDKLLEEGLETIPLSSARSLDTLTLSYSASRLNQASSLEKSAAQVQIPAPQTKSGQPRAINSLLDEELVPPIATLQPEYLSSFSSWRRVLAAKELEKTYLELELPSAGSDEPDYAPSEEDEQTQSLDFDAFIRNFDHHYNSAKLSQLRRLCQGSGFGSFFHSLMEKLDVPLFEKLWSGEKEAIKLMDELVRPFIIRYGLQLAEPLLLPSASPQKSLIYQLIRNTLDCRLQDEVELELSKALSLSPGMQMRELEFTFRIRKNGSLAPELLQALTYSEKTSALSGLAIRRGYLVGVIDLLFVHNNRLHVLDYKTSTITPEHGVEEAMEESQYRLQAQLYLAAAFKLLQQAPGGRPYALGDAWYVFVRTKQVVRIPGQTQLIQALLDQGGLG